HRDAVREIRDLLAERADLHAVGLAHRTRGERQPTREGLHQRALAAAVAADEADALAVQQLQRAVLEQRAPADPQRYVLALEHRLSALAADLAGEAQRHAALAALRLADELQALELAEPALRLPRHPARLVAADELHLLVDEGLLVLVLPCLGERSDERRVGKGWRSR